MKKLITLVSVILLFSITKVNGQPCKLVANLTESNFNINPKDPDFRDKCIINVTVTNLGTCGWEKGKIKLNWQLAESPPKARSFPSLLLKGSTDLKAVVLPGKSGQFNAIDFPWPEYPGLYQVEFWISYDGKPLSKEVTIDINWD
jgi:hypothetical protein